MHRTVPLILFAVTLFYQLVHLEAATTSTPSTSTDLTFAESVYVKMSSTCRAIMDFRYSAKADQNELTKEMKITVLDDNKTMTFPIQEAFKALTKPSIFDIRKQTKIIIHGYKDNSLSAIPLDLGAAYSEKKIFNVLLVDAKELVDKGYILAAHNTRIIGKRLANLLANLDNIGANPEDFHILGISLGAHIAGWTGKYFKQFKIQNIGHITGLDPAGPCFSYAYSNQRLDKTDADYVDVIHTNRLVQGVIEPLGHADFYVNGGGPNQPGCLMPSCSHLRAAQIYIESIRRPKSFVALKCDTWSNFQNNACKPDDYTVLGYGSSAMSRGLYFLRTAVNPPYGLGLEGTRNIEPIVENWLKTLNIN